MLRSLTRPSSTWLAEETSAISRGASRLVADARLRPPRVAAAVEPGDDTLERPNGPSLTVS
jgi:hypothetical protein